MDRRGLFIELREQGSIKHIKAARRWNSLPSLNYKAELIEEGKYLLTWLPKIGNRLPELLSKRFMHHFRLHPCFDTSSVDASALEDEGQWKSMHSKHTHDRSDLSHIA
jgi:hypothetical protein